MWLVSLIRLNLVVSSLTFHTKNTALYTYFLLSGWVSCFASPALSWLFPCYRYRSHVISCFWDQMDSSNGHSHQEVHWLSPIGMCLKVDVMNCYKTEQTHSSSFCLWNGRVESSWCNLWNIQYHNITLATIMHDNFYSDILLMYMYHTFVWGLQLSCAGR